MTTKIRIERRSKLPSQRLGNNGFPMMSYAYKVLDPEVLEQIKAEAGVDEISGTYTPEGTEDVLIYSRTRVGQLNKPVSVDFRINTTDDGRSFLNIVDNSDDSILDIAAQVENVGLISGRMADALAQTAAQSLFGQRVRTQPAPVRRVPTPVPAGGGDDNPPPTGGGQGQQGMTGNAGGDDDKPKDDEEE